MTQESENQLNELIRDITSVGFMAKSEATRRLEAIIEAELSIQENYVMIEKLQKYVVPPFNEQYKQHSNLAD